MAELLLLPCPRCRRDCLTEVPPCLDGHGSECPDRACVECGTALWIDVLPVDGAGEPAATRAA